MREFTQGQRQLNPEGTRTPGSIQDLRKIIFFLEMPEPIGIAHGSTFTFEVDHPTPMLQGIRTQPERHLPPFPPEFAPNLALSLKFWQVNAHMTIDPSGVAGDVMQAVLPDDLHPTGKQEPLLIDSYRTVVEAVTFYLPVKGNKAIVNECFDRCLASLQDLVRAYRLAARNNVPVITQERLPATILYATCNAVTNDEWEQGMFALNFNVPFAVEILNPPSMERLGIYLSHVRKMFPLVTYQEFTSSARSALDKSGDYRSSVIDTQTAFEVLMDGLLTLMFWEEGADPQHIARTVFTESFAKRIRTHFSPRLGGNWDTTGSGPLGEWSRVIANTRGRVVHGGYRPSYSEAAECLNVLERVDTFVRQRLVRSRNRFKRTALVFLGQPGLERLNAWSGAIRHFAEVIAPNESDWIQSYVAWRKKMDAAR